MIFDHVYLPFSSETTEKRFQHQFFNLEKPLLVSTGRCTVYEGTQLRRGSCPLLAVHE